MKPFNPYDDDDDVSLSKSYSKPTKPSSTDTKVFDPHAPNHNDQPEKEEEKHVDLDENDDYQDDNENETVEYDDNLKNDYNESIHKDSEETHLNKRPRTSDTHLVDHNIQHNGSTSNASPFQPLFGENVLNELTETVSRFLADNMKLAMNKMSNDSELEIEAKLGIIVDRQSQNRYNCPIYSATALIHQDFMNFNSDMDIKQHQFFNELLNSSVQKGILKYKRRKEIDRMYYDKGRLRVTTDENGGFITAIRKNRIANLEILLPNSPLDIRISVNIEEPASKVDDLGPPDIKRDKNRVSYEKAPIRIDLTQVKQFKNENNFDIQTHELEVEFINGKQLYHEFENLQHGRPNTYHYQIEHFLNTLRYLSHKSPYMPKVHP